jgi:hypothetical protein
MTDSQLKEIGRRKKVAKNMLGGKRGHINIDGQQVSATVTQKGKLTFKVNGKKQVVCPLELQSA